ncbi:putative Tat pathway signal sequence domain protein [Candidatus Sulfopaludibacter sp. SbA4]|nr:putative Tat pathway signal sequence domain protein [Candidatus Sulfopaludibacter sp. SbA4]
MDSQANRRSFLVTAGASVLAAGASALDAQTEKPIRIAIIGTGTRSWAHLAILKTLPQFQVVALADPTPQNLDRGASLAPGAKTYSDYRKLLAERNDIDAVIVITPSFLHAEVTIAALDRGLPVLCEKPMATKVEDANRMIEASRKSGKLLYIGFQKRLVPTTAKMRELIAAGEIGAIQFVSGNLFRGDWNPASWKYTDPKTGVATNWRYLTFTEGSALLEDGIHEMDTLNWMIASPVVRVTAAGGNNVFKQRETIDNAALIVEYESGVKLSFDFCLFAANAGPGSRRMVIIGSEGVMQPENGRVAIRGRSGSAVRYVDVVDNTPKEATATQVGSAQDPETYKQYLAFEQSLRTGRPPAVSPEDGKTAIKLMLLAEKSLRTHRIMTWNDLPA